MKNIKTMILVLLAFLAFSCEKSEPTITYKYNYNPTFTWGYAQFYGAYYTNYQVPNNVLSIHLFSEGLKIADNKLDGTGHYLVISDLFLQPTDTLLAVGKYTVANTRKPFTFFAGEEFKDNRNEIPTGTYIYFVEPEPSKSKVAYVTDGSLEVEIENDSVYSINAQFTLDDKESFKATYRHPLHHFDASATVKSGIKGAATIKVNF